jgi:hypothetical protein
VSVLPVYDLEHQSRIKNKSLNYLSILILNPTLALIVNKGSTSMSLPLTTEEPHVTSGSSGSYLVVVPFAVTSTASHE